MNPVTQKLKRDWLAKENIELVQKRRRRYLHFDDVLEYVSPSVFAKVTSSEFVERYAFFPLLKQVQKVRLYKKDPVTKKKLILPKERPISYAAHFDSLIYSWYAFQLESIYETVLTGSTISNSVIAYRKLGKSNLQFAREVFAFIESKGDCVAIALDIKGFYDNLNHRALKKAWKNILSEKDLPNDHYRVYRSVTSFTSVLVEEIKKMLGLKSADSHKMRLFLGIDLLGKLRSQKILQVNKSKKGIPQGTPISCVLSNIYMHDFDLAVQSAVENVGGMYRRYSDDIIVVCPLEKKDSLMKTLDEQIGFAMLTIESSKTDIRQFKRISQSDQVCTDEQGKKSSLQYLGVVFDGARMSLRHKGYAKFERNMTRSVRREVAKARELKVAIAKRKLYEKFTPLGEMNYVKYVQRAERELKSPNIGKSVRHSLLVKKIKRKVKENSS